MNSLKQLAKLRFPSRAYQLKQVRCVVGNVMRKLGFQKQQVEQIVIATNEACMNIIQHGYGDEIGEIILEVLLSKEFVLFRISDFAKPINLDNIKSRDLSVVRPGGLGVHFIQEIMDEVKYRHRDDGKGNVVELKKYLKQIT